MNQDSLLLFIKRILNSGSNSRSTLSLQQLAEILELQGADPSAIELVRQTLECLPETKTAAKDTCFNEERLRIAIQRGQTRRRREEEMASRGRC